MTPEHNFKFDSYNKWNHEIFEAILVFHDTYQCLPNILQINTWTGQRIDGLISIECFEKGMPDFVKSLSVFKCRLTEVECCQDEKLNDHEFRLIFDDQAEFIDPEDFQGSQKIKNEGYEYAA